MVDTAPVAIDKLKTAVKTLDDFMQWPSLICAPEEVANLKDDATRSQFINLFKEVQWLNTQLDQYTDLSDGNMVTIDEVMPKGRLQNFRGGVSGHRAAADEGVGQRP